jgi:hypothetical protein
VLLRQRILGGRLLRSLRHARSRSSRIVRVRRLGFSHRAEVALRSLGNPLGRYGSDIVVVWDAEDDTSDVYLAAAVMIAKALALRTKTTSKATPIDIDALDSAVREIERQAGWLEEIRTSSGTIKSSAEKILGRIEQMRAALSKQIASLDRQALALREFVDADGTSRDAAS